MELIVISISSVFITIFLICSLYWAIVFVRRIRVYKVYQKSAFRNILDYKFGYINEQWCYHYETEILKYIYLLAINSAEALASISYYFRQISLHILRLLQSCISIISRELKHVEMWITIFNQEWDDLFINCVSEHFMGFCFSTHRKHSWSL